MKAIVYSQPGLPIQDPRSLYETELPKPEPGPADVLIEVTRSLEKQLWMIRSQL